MPTTGRSSSIPSSARSRERAAGSIHSSERLEVQSQRNHGEAARWRDLEHVGHLTGLIVREDDQLVGALGQLPLDLQEEPCLPSGEVATPENVPVERVDDHGDAGYVSGQTPHRPRLGGVRVYDRGPLATQEPKKLQKRTQVVEWREQPGHSGDLRDLHAPFAGVVGHVSLVLGDAAGDQPRAKASGVEGLGQVHDMHGRSTRVEPCDEPVHENQSISSRRLRFGRGGAHASPTRPDS